MIAERVKDAKPKEILDLAIATSLDISNDRERGEALCDIVEVLLENDQKERARSMLKRSLKCARNASIGSARAMVLCRIAEIRAVIEDEKRADKLLDEALDHVEHVSFSVDQKAEALTDIVEVMKKIRGEEKALDLAREITNNYGRSTALARIAESLAEKGQYDKAKEILNQAIELAERIVFSLERKARVRSEIAVALSENDEEERALDIVRNISFGSQKKKALVNIAFKAVDNFKPEEARVILDESLSIATTIQTCSAKACAFSEISRAMIRNGDKERTEKILKDSLKLAERISLPLRHERVKAFSSIANTLAEKGEDEKAEHILDRALRMSYSISNDSKRVKALTKVAEAKFRLD